MVGNLVYQKVVNLVNQRQAIGFMKEDIAYMDSFYKQHGRYVNDDGNSLYYLKPV